MVSDLGSSKICTLDMYLCHRPRKIEEYVNDAIFICYAPFDNPEVAVAIVVERGKAGANCAFMARQILDAYFNIKSYTDTSEPEMALLK